MKHSERPSLHTTRSSHVTMRVEPALETDEVRSARAPTLLFTLEGSIARILCNEREWRVDRARFAVVAPGTRYRVEKVSVITKLVSLEFGKAALDLVLRDYGAHIEPTAWREVLSTSALLPRTRWVDELAHRYRFERDICSKHDSAASRFLETELLKETYFVALSQQQSAERVSVLHQGSTQLERARAFIDANLEQPLSMRALARRCHLSESSLLRLFMNEVGVSPSEYTRGRRLDYALDLLESKRLSVGEVAHRAGYTSAAAFSVAFKKRFGCVPSNLDPDVAERARGRRAASPSTKRSAQGPVGK